MKLSKWLKTSLVSLVILLLIVIAGMIYMIYNQSEETIDTMDNVPLDKLEEYSYQTPEITTDLKDGTFVRIQFQIVCNSKQAQREIEKREFQLQNLIIKELAKLEEEDIKINVTELESKLEEKIDEMMKDGKVLQVLTTNKIMQ